MEGISTFHLKFCLSSLNEFQMKTYQKYLYIVLATLTMWMLSCKPMEDASPGIGVAPTSSDVAFTIIPTENPNILTIESTSLGAFIFKWKLGNGAVAEGKKITVTYPLAGDYLIELAINTAGGKASSTQVINIANTDFSLLDTEENRNLTGGFDDLDGKTWVIDSTNFGHMGVGPAASITPEWWQAPPNDKAGMGLYNDRYTFKLKDFVFEWNTDGDVFANAAHAADIGGVNNGQDQKVAKTSPTGLTWGLTTDANGKKFLALSDASFMGFYTGVSTFEVLKLTSTELYIKFLDAKNPDLAWYHRLIPAGYTPPTANFTASVADKTATFTNTSVASATYIWDFGDGNTSTAENPAHTYADFGSYSVKLTATNADGASSTVTKSVSIVAPFGLSDLTGGSTKTWKLKTGAGTWGVGPNAGDISWYPGGTDISGDRSCIWNDTYTFKSNGELVYNAEGDVYVEGYMNAGVADGCHPTSVLSGKDANVWNSGTHSFSFTAGSGATKSKISLQGLGAFIGIAKAFDGGEFSVPPTSDNYNVMYEVIGYSNDSGVETLSIAINIGGGWWSFVLVAQ
jgi:PKD repeat protein